MSRPSSKLPPPKRFVAQLLRDNERNAPWLRSVAQLLGDHVKGTGLQRLMTVWNLSSSDIATMFGVSRQAVTKWLEAGPPVERAVALAPLEDATELLERHLRPERIPVVVRRPAPLLGQQSLLDLAMRGEHDKLLVTVRVMFDLRRVQP